MKQGKKTASEKRKEQAKPRNHPRSKQEKISNRKPVPQQSKNPDSGGPLINPNKP